MDRSAARVAPLHADEDFVKAFGERFGVIADRITAGLTELTHLTTYTADEVALQLIVDRAEEMADGSELDQDWTHTLPDRPNDGNFHGVKDYLFYSFDVLHLYDASANGAEDLTLAVFQAEGFVNLHPLDWFKTFVK